MKENYKNFKYEGFANAYTNFAEEIIDSYDDSEKKDFVILGLGSAAYVGNSLPLIANDLLENYCKVYPALIKTNDIHIYGDFNSPINDKNLIKTVKEIKDAYNDPFILVIVVDEGNIGDIELKNTQLEISHKFKKFVFGDMVLSAKVCKKIQDIQKNKINLGLVRDIAATITIITLIAAMEISRGNALIEDNIYNEQEIDTNEYLNKILNSKANKNQVKNKPKKNLKSKIRNPKDLYDFLNTVMVGQDVAKKKVSVELFEHYLRVNNKDYLKDKNEKIEKGNLLITGMTGTGKTFMMQKLAEYLDLPLYIQDCKELSDTGYVGGKATDCLKGLLEVAKGNLELAEKGIVILDEFDKLSDNGRNDDVSGKKVQQCFLKIVEGTKVNVSSLASYGCTQVMDTSNILFVALGSFDGIEKIINNRINKNNQIGFGATINSKHKLQNEETRKSITRTDIINYGFSKEVLGRFPVLINFDPLTKENLIQIMKLKQGFLNSYKIEFELLGKKLNFNEDIYDYIAEEAIKLKLGARSLRSIIKDVMNEFVFNICNEQKEYTLSLDYIKSLNK